MHSIGNYVARHLVVKQAPADGSRRALMQRAQCGDVSVDTPRIAARIG